MGELLTNNNLRVIWYKMYAFDFCKPLLRRFVQLTLVVILNSVFADIAKT